MSVYAVQFQHGMSIPEFFQHFGSEDQCLKALERLSWPSGFQCPKCAGSEHYTLHVRKRKTHQCQSCGHQTSVTAGTLFHASKLPLTRWFLAIYLISQAKTGLSALALKRQVGVSYPTAWMMHHKIMQAMVERERKYTLSGYIQIDDVYLGGERSGGKVGRGSENKVPFIAAVSVTPEGQPIHLKLSPISGFTRKAIAQWAHDTLDPNSWVLSDGLPGFNGVIEAHCHHQVQVVAGRKPHDLPDFKWVNTLIGNVKTSLSGAYHSFRFNKYAERYLGAIMYRFNRRFDLHALPERLLMAALLMSPCPERKLRLAEHS